MDKSFSEKLTESENVKKVSPKSALYRHTEGFVKYTGECRPPKVLKAAN